MYAVVATCPFWPEHVNSNIVYMEWIKNFDELFEEKITFHLATTAPLKEEKEGLQFTKNTCTGVV